MKYVIVFFLLCVIAFAKLMDNKVKNQNKLKQKIEKSTQARVFFNTFLPHPLQLL